MNNNGKKTPTPDKEPDIVNLLQRPKNKKTNVFEAGEVSGKIADAPVDLATERVKKQLEDI